MSVIPWLVGAVSSFAVGGILGSRRFRRDLEKRRDAQSDLDAIHNMLSDLMALAAEDAMGLLLMYVQAPAEDRPGMLDFHRDGGGAHQIRSAVDRLGPAPEADDAAGEEEKR